MIKFITILLMLFTILNLNAQEPQIKIRLADGAERTYLISDVEEMSFLKSDVFSYMSIYFTDSTKRNFDTKSIEKMEIVEENELLSIYTCSYPYSYEISTIDSIVSGSEVNDLYETVTIGAQVWMKRNLDVTHYRNGDSIPQVLNPSEWTNLTTGAWCYYNNDPDNCALYGKLYNWHAVNDERGLAPEGWRVPSDEDWKELEMHLGMTKEIADVWGRRGSPLGPKLAGGDEFWDDRDLRNHPEFNCSGFSGLPGGARHKNGIFQHLNFFAYWWSSTEFTLTDAITRFLFYYHTTVYRNFHQKSYGFSVRCIRDE